MVGEMPAEEANTRFRRLFKIQIHTRRESWVCLVVRGGGVYPNSCHVSLEISPEGLGIPVHGRESRTRLPSPAPTLRIALTLAAPSCHHNHWSRIAHKQLRLSESPHALKSSAHPTSLCVIISDRDSRCLVSRARLLALSPYA